MTFKIQHYNVLCEHTSLKWVITVKYWSWTKTFNKISKNNKTTQRSISKELDVALGFANSLIKKFLRKGLFKITEAPMKRYIYYITPKGFVEKSVSWTIYWFPLAFYKKTKKEYEDEFLKIKEQNFNKVL